MQSAIIATLLIFGTAEPTSVDTETYGGFSLNTRGGFSLDWEPGKGPLFGPSETILIEGAPGEGTAANLEIYLEWDE